MSADTETREDALGSAVFRGDTAMVLRLIPHAERTWLTAGISDAVQIASMVGRRCCWPADRTEDHITERVDALRRVATDLILADAGMPDISTCDDELVDGIVAHLDAVSEILPVAGIVAWVWAHRIAAECTHLVAVAAYADGVPLGLDDPVVAAWAARRAVEHAGEPWAMRLLAAIGAAAR